jgi:hypothetical protein
VAHRPLIKSYASHVLDLSDYKYWSCLTGGVLFQLFNRIH